MKLIITRSDWGRGGVEGGFFLSEDKKYCALGFLLKACDIPDEELLGRGALSELPTKFVDYVPTSFYENRGGWVTTSKWADRLIAANDSDMITDAEREAELTLYFSIFGVDVTFQEDHVPSIHPRDIPHQTDESRVATQ